MGGFKTWMLLIILIFFSVGMAQPQLDGNEDDSVDDTNDPDNYSDLLNEDDDEHNHDDDNGDNDNDDNDNEDDDNEDNDNEEDDNEDDDNEENDNDNEEEDNDSDKDENGDENDNDVDDNEDNKEKEEMNGLYNNYPCCTSTYKPHYPHLPSYQHHYHIYHGNHVYHPQYHPYGYHYQPPCVCQTTLPKTCCCGSVRVRMSLQLKQTWDADYQNPTSTKYKQLKKKFVTSMDDLFETTASCKGTYQGCRLTTFRSPAVTASFILVFQSCSGNPLLPLYKILASGKLPHGLAIYPALNVIENSIPQCARICLQPPTSLAGLVKGNGLSTAGCKASNSKSPGSSTSPNGAKPGTKPSGTKPSRTNPSGTKPKGTNPSGNKPSGTKPSGTKPSGPKTTGKSNPPVTKPSPKALSQLFSSAPPPPSAPKAAKPPSLPPQPLPNMKRLVKKQSDKDCEKETTKFENSVRKNKKVPPLKKDSSLASLAKQVAEQIANSRTKTPPTTTSRSVKNSGLKESVSIQCVTKGFIRCETLSRKKYEQEKQFRAGGSPQKYKDYALMVSKKTQRIGTGKMDYKVGKEQCTVLVTTYSTL